MYHSCITLYHFASLLCITLMYVLAQRKLTSYPVFDKLAVILTTDDE